MKEMPADDSQKIVDSEQAAPELEKPVITASVASSTQDETKLEAEKVAEDIVEEKAKDKPEEMAPGKAKGKSNISNIIALLCVAVVIGLNLWVFMGAKGNSTGVAVSLPGNSAGEIASNPPQGNVGGKSSKVSKGKLPGAGEVHPPQPGVVTEPHPEGGMPGRPAPKRGAQKPGEALPGPNETPVPPGPGSKGSGEPASASAPSAQPEFESSMPPTFTGPQLLLGVGLFSGHSKLPLTLGQKKELTAILVELDKVQQGLLDVTKQCLSCLTPEQVDWMVNHRGPAVIDNNAPVEPGMDPTTSAANALLRKKAVEGKKAKQYKHTTPELLFHDILNGVLRLDTEAPKLALDGAQAQSMLPFLTKANELRQKETKNYAQIYGLLSEEQVAYLEANPEMVRMDVNSVILHYVQTTLK